MTFRVGDTLNLLTRTTDPATGLEGDTYWNSVSELIRVHDGEGWTNVGGATAANIYEGLQQGVLSSGQAALTVGSTSSVTIAAAVVYILSGSVLVRAVSSSTVLSSIPAAVNNRIDQVVVNGEGVVSRLQGTSDLVGNTLAANPQSGGGRLAIPAGAMLLHDMQVTSGGVIVGNCRDRRSWARGGRYYFTDGTARNISNGSFANSGGITWPRMEFTGVPVDIMLRARIYSQGGGANTTWLDFALNGTRVANTTDGLFKVSPGGGGQNILLSATAFPAAGSYVISVQDRVANDWGMFDNAAFPFAFTIQESLRQNNSNGT